MDLKTALKDILPKLKLKPKRFTTDEWVVDRPVEFIECHTCGDMIDDRIVSVCCITASNDYTEALYKRYYTWCEIHSAREVIDYCAKATPCRLCFRWAVMSRKSGICHMCASHMCEFIIVPPSIQLKSWYKEHMAGSK